MRATFIYRQLKKMMILLFTFWMLYTSYEFMLLSNKSVNEFGNLGPKSVRHISKNPSNILRHVHEDKVLPEKHAQNNIHDRQMKIDEPSHSWVNSNQTPKNIEHSENEKLQHFYSKVQQLDKLAEMGGKLVEKKSSGAFSKVILPLFNDQQNSTGPGEQGVGVNVNINSLPEDEKSKYHKGWSSNAFNQYASDLISVHRSLPECRNVTCKEQTWGYATHFQEVSVVIIFHNEAWSVLLRSVHSILSRTPERILREIILVDDFSSADYLKNPLEKYFNDFPKVKIVRATKRQGLTRARLLGYFVSSAPIIVFLDSHIECHPGWVEPLIFHIGQNPRAVVFPTIDSIDTETLQMKCILNKKLYGTFDFQNLNFKWYRILESEKHSKNVTEPRRSPTMPGGLFAISREFFERLGTYDPGLDYWGGENIELSFKAWMCGGSVETVPCSRIGHIYRKKNPIKWSNDIGLKNSIRVAEVWMDDYKNYFYERINYNLGDYGNVTERKELRKRLQCKNFEWYVRNVLNAPNIPSQVKYAGEIRSVPSERCVDTLDGPQKNQTAPKLYPCHGKGRNQFWYFGDAFDDAGEIHQDGLYVCFSGGKILFKAKCESLSPTWKYREDMTLLHNPTGLCLTAGVITDDLNLTTCTDNKYQKWKLQPRRTDLHFPPLLFT